MSTFATITLTQHGLELRCPAANRSEDRRLAADDGQRFQGWGERYLAAIRKDGDHNVLLELGSEMLAWLEGPTSCLTLSLEAATAPVIIEFTVARLDERDLAKAFLNAPWELLAKDGQFWALRPDLVFCPVRRVGKAAVPAQPSANRLGLVFMAAAPRGADNLDYEAEEASILNATRDLGLDLSVEESGTPELLSASVAREKPDVIQISCHGTLHPNPGLLLEDEIGDQDFVEANKLATRLAAHHPRLLFLSACETAQGDLVLPSLARSLVLAGTPAVLGWAAPVLDREATIFGASLYNSLTKGADLAHALAYSRLELAENDKLPERIGAGPRSRDWHLARLFLNPAGGGALATAGGPQRHLAGQAMKTFLDAKGKQVPVAGELEFVGRRREIQAILREFRTPIGGRHAGVFIHGVGRQGKSSLAARVARRLEHSHEIVVIFGRYDAPFILRTLGERLATPTVTEIVARHLPLVETDKSKLLTALTELLEGPCAQAGSDGARPVLLVIDDFEQALDEQNCRTIKPDYLDSIRALLLAFGAASTDSHLLFTCRYQFTCPHDARDLADGDHLLDLPLHGMSEREARKQAQAKLRLPEIARTVARLSGKNREALEGQVTRAIINARGNPGLQDLLFTLAVQDPAACDRCLAQMENFLRGGTLPAEDKVRKFLENLALQSLIGLLTSAERELLRAATLFELPVPVAVMEALSQSLLTPAATERLLALGLLEVYEDLYDSQRPALALNALVRPVSGTLSEKEQAALAAAVLAGPLFDQWGGETGHKRRSFQQDYELVRLGLLARNAGVLAACGADALRFLDDEFQYQQAATWAKAMIAIVDKACVRPSMDLLRTAAERCQQVGDVNEANTLRERAMEVLADGGEADVGQNAATLVTHARALVDQGQPDEALKHLQQAKKLLPSGRERAIVTGDIARILTDKGEVDAALKLHQEEIAIYEALGDKRSRAVTLGDIARILTAKGEVDAALRLHQERLMVYEALGNKRGRAVALGDIARILTDKGEVHVALKLHQEEIAIYEALGDKRFRAITLGDIANIHASRGNADKALELHDEELKIYEELGDIDSKAVTLWDIAQIEIRQQKLKKAFNHVSESYDVMLKLGHLEGISMVGLTLGQMLCGVGDREKGLQILTRSRDGFLKLGRAQMAEQTEVLIARYSQSPPPPPS